MDEPKFISHLEEARKEVKLSQEKLAQKVGATRETIRNIEKGISIPNVILALAIAAIVGWAVNDLFKQRKEG
jgi:DNA-binding XRE family transcriptional regulator